jgi:hypothetical protein
MLDPINQLTDAIYFLKKAPYFIKKNRLWEGYWKHGWIAQSTIVLGALFTVFFIYNIYNTFSSPGIINEKSDPISMGLIIEKVYFQGGIKYLLLILLEMLIFHFSTKTLDILENKESSIKPKEFISAQIRMIKISIRNYFFEIVIGILLSIVLGILGSMPLKSFMMLFVQFYFIGFAFMDNYYEQKNLTIKESGSYIKEHLIAAIVIGAAGYGLFMIPLAGAIIAPFICAVAATSYLHHKNVGIDELELADDADLAFKP